MSTNIYISGQAITQFGELWNRSFDDLCQEAVDGAIISTQLEAEAIEAVFVANKAAGNFTGQHHLNALVSQLLPHHPPSMRIEGACASGGLALLAAEFALLS